MKEGDVMTPGTGTGLTIDQRHAARRQLIQSGWQIVHGKGDVMQAAALLKELFETGVLSARLGRDQLDTGFALGWGQDKGGFGQLGRHVFARSSRQAQDIEP